MDSIKLTNFTPESTPAVNNVQHAIPTDLIYGQFVLCACVLVDSIHKFAIFGLGCTPKTSEMREREHKFNTQE